MCYKLLRLYDGIYKLVYYAEDGSYSLTLKKLESADDAQEYNPFPHQVKLSIALLAENLCDMLICIDTNGQSEYGNVSKFEYKR